MKEKIKQIINRIELGDLAYHDAETELLDLYADSGSLHTAMNEIENAMERWHLARDNDDETLEEINRILVSIGMLGWFNRNDR